MTFVQRHPRAWAAGGIVVAGAGAYHFTLASLFDFLRLDTPLAFVPLLPIVALGLALITARRYARAKRPLRDRHVDLLVGLPLVVVALILITLAPVIASTYYWSDRTDVISLALFAAGATMAVFGVAWFWRLKASFILLLLAWPPLYLRALGGLLQGFAGSANVALAQLVGRFPLGEVLGSGPGVLAVRQPHGHALSIAAGTVSPAANAMLGFAVVGGAVVISALQGGARRKLLWWADGVALAFVLSAIRLLLLVVLAAHGHPDLGTGAFHAAISALVLVLVLVVMVLAAPRFGLHLKEPVLSRHATVAHPAPATLPTGRSSRLATGRRVAAAVTVLGLTAFMALVDQGLQPFSNYLDANGEATVRPFSAPASVPKSWHLEAVLQNPWAGYYFGGPVTWIRYRMAPTGVRAVVYADVIVTPDKASLDNRDMVGSVLFRGYAVRTWQRVDLGDGVYGFMLNYVEPTDQARWAAVSWVWPVLSQGQTLYERIVLTSTSNVGTHSAPGLQPGSALQDVFLGLLDSAGGEQSVASVLREYHDVDVALEATGQRLVRRALALRG